MPLADDHSGPTRGRTSLELVKFWTLSKQPFFLWSGWPQSSAKTEVPRTEWGLSRVDHKE